MRLETDLGVEGRDLDTFLSVTAFPGYDGDSSANCFVSARASIGPSIR